MDSPNPEAEARHAPARNRRKLDYVVDDPLLTAQESAIETGRGRSTFWRDVRAGLLPPAYYVTPRNPRWRRSELRAAVAACRGPATRGT
jgi:predicted DNA-binding transcriptional regulator AlpA